MRFLAIGTWDSADPRIPQLLTAEKKRTGELAEEGFIEQVLLRADGGGGFMIVDAATADAAHERLATLPFMQEGLMSVELVELKG